MREAGQPSLRANALGVIFSRLKNSISVMAIRMLHDRPIYHNLCEDAIFLLTLGHSRRIAWMQLI